MKKNIFVFIALAVASLAMATNGQFEKAMSRGIPGMFAARDAESLQAAINQLNRIGEAEGDRWEPYYYSAFGYLRMSSMVESIEEKDKYLELSLEEVKKGEMIKPNDSELETMRGYVIMLQLAVDPATRGMTHSGAAFASFQKAIQLNPENPRAHYLLGRMQHGTAQFMGGGSEEACGSFQKAFALLENEKNDNPFAPSWGKEEAEKALEGICQAGE